MQPYLQDFSKYIFTFCSSLDNNRFNIVCLAIESNLNCPVIFSLFTVEVMNCSNIEQGKLPLEGGTSLYFDRIAESDVKNEEEKFSLKLTSLHPPTSWEASHFLCTPAPGPWATALSWWRVQNSHGAGQYFQLCNASPNPRFLREAFPPKRNRLVLEQFPLFLQNEFPNW